MSNVLRVQNGFAHVYYAFDVGTAIDLEAAERILGSRLRNTFKANKRVSKFFTFTPAPIELSQVCGVLPVGPNFRTVESLEILIFDFASISVSYKIPITGSLDQLVDLSLLLFEQQILKEPARKAVQSLIDELRPAMVKPEISQHIEDYFVYQITEFSPEMSMDDIVKTQMSPIANVLRAERLAISEREMQNIASTRISYGVNDLAFVDWNAALVFDKSADDMCTVMEFANLTLMELSHLDQKLDRALDEFYVEFLRREEQKGIRHLFSMRNNLKSIGQLQIDNAVFFERVTNALKIFGDDFLTRVYQLASQKMGLMGWETSITRKLQTIEDIYEKVQDNEGQRRMEILEWIVIILIAVSILLPLKK